MKYAKSFIIMAVIFFLQPFAASIVPVAGRPDVMLAIMFITVLSYGEKEALPYIAAGFVFLFLKDLAVGPFPGISIFSAAAVIIYAVIMNRLANPENPWFVLLVTAGEPVLHQSVLWVEAKASGYPESIIYAAGRVYTNVIAEIIVIMFIYFAFVYPELVSSRSRFFR